ncbi:putative iron-dependent peroxidase [Kitasatospora sp. GP30]|uniref:Dyp-type peroxidase n=1 Tax=Kitasatospora sp. GP30 TaxID=3035084 RepID=UPI000C711727|nr:Dyp-type peroxidase [Kitasatospora sp. GP30]MDH6140192.1 putative iron-dependent peroxidase [Kitasatospora sp. GP30]
MTDARPQTVSTPLTSAARFLVLTVRPGGEGAVRELLPELAGLRRAVGFRVPDGRLSCVTGIGSALWDRLFGGPRPAELHPFPELHGPRHTAPATPGDLLLHLRAERADVCFELAGQIMARLGDAVRVADETAGFQYFDRRDLLGFVDGTENPEDAEADAAALIGAEDPAFAGGSYVIVQKYLHDLTAWQQLGTDDQERAIGRTKLADIELPDELKPADSHVALTSLDPAPDGTERQILRANMPFGSFADGEFGTYFIGYCRTPAVTEEMLRNMFLGRGTAGHDRILDFSTAVTGSLFFVPPADLLDDPPPAGGASDGTAPTAVVPGAAAAATAEPATAPPSSRADGSLGIGSLRRSPHR